VFKWGEGEGLGQDGFPKIPIPEMKLKGRGRWTDVLTAGLPASWSVGFLCNEKALAVFKQFDLGMHREYPVTVRDRKNVARNLTYLLVRNRLPQSAIDLGNSEFYVADRIQYKRLVLRRDQLPTADLFQLERLRSVVYISARLKEAIEKFRVTGLEIRANKKLFTGR